MTMIHEYRSPDLLLVAGLTPLLAMTQTALSGFIAGLIIILLILLTALLAFMIRPYVPADQKWLLIMLLASVLVGTFDRLLESMLPELHGVYGLYLPLLVVVPLCSILPAESGVNTRLAVVMAKAAGYGLFYFPVIFTFGCLREIIVTGSLLSDSDLILGNDYSLHLVNWQLVLISRVAGALLLAGLLLAGINKVKSARGKVER